MFAYVGGAAAMEVTVGLIFLYVHATCMPRMWAPAAIVIGFICLAGMMLQPIAGFTAAVIVAIGVILVTQYRSTRTGVNNPEDTDPGAD